MSFPFYIARRYLFSKKSTHAINIISGISAVGVAVATVALVVTLSVFNGFSDLVATFFTSFDPQLKIVPVKGKTMPADAPELDKVRQLAAVEVATNSLEDQALAVYRDKQEMVLTTTLRNWSTSIISSWATARSTCMPPTSTMESSASGWHRRWARVPNGATTCISMRHAMRDN